jgi:uncharacterized protein (DUF2141 family)
VKAMAGAFLILASAPASAATLTVHLTGIASSSGQIQVAVCNRSFDTEGCPYGATRKPAPPTMDVVFPDLPNGRYAVAVYHDQDGSGALNKNMLSLPTEPYGFSNDIGRLGPPSFSDALFEMKGDTTINVTVKPLFGG